jgi:hypothetical protein
MGSFILFPFAKEIVKSSISEENPKKEVIEKIDSLNPSDPRSVQLVLQVGAEVLEIDVQGDRREWLYDFKEI